MEAVVGTWVEDINKAREELTAAEGTYNSASEKEDEANDKFYENILQYARTFSYSELLNAFEEGNDEYLNELNEEERKDLLFTKQKELAAKEIIPGLNPDALEDLIKTTGKDFGTLISELAEKHLVLDEALEKHQKTLDDLTESYEDLVGAAKLDNITQ